MKLRSDQAFKYLNAARAKDAQDWRKQVTEVQQTQFLKFNMQTYYFSDFLYGKMPNTLVYVCWWRKTFWSFAQLSPAALNHTQMVAETSRNQLKKVACCCSSLFQAEHAAEDLVVELHSTDP